MSISSEIVTSHETYIEECFTSFTNVAHVVSTFQQVLGKPDHLTF
jgi:hypothetical protein